MIINPQNFGGTAPVIESLSVTQNGTTIAPAGTDGYNPVTVNVPGLPTGIVEIACGEITYTSDIPSGYSLSIAHGMAQPPTNVLMTVEELPAGNTVYAGLILSGAVSGSFRKWYSASISLYTGDVAPTITDTVVSFRNSAPIPANTTYKWIAWR